MPGSSPLARSAPETRYASCPAGPPGKALTGRDRGRRGSCPPGCGQPDVDLALSGVAVQECEGLLVEAVDVFVDRGVRAVLEYDEFGVRDCRAERIGEAGRGHHVVAPEGEQGGRLDRAEDFPGVVGQDGF